MQDNRNDVIRVGLVDDHVILIQPFFDTLNRVKGIKAVFLVYSGEELLQLLKSAPELPDIILMDIEMPGISGIEATKLVNKLYPEIKIIALTSKDNPYSVVQMREAGACAYFRKDVRFDILEEAIRQIHEQGNYHGDLSNQQPDTIDKEIKEEATVLFSEREVEVLHWMSLGYTYDQTAEAMHLSTSGMDKHRQSLCGKLHTNKQAVMIRKALQMGILPLNKK